MRVVRLSVLTVIGLFSMPVPAQEYTLAFASMGPLNSDIFLAGADGSNPKPFLPHPALDYNASFSKDGRWIVFTSERDGSADVYRARPDGSDLMRLTDHPAFEDQGALSPDGRRLAFVSTRSGNADIWIVDLQTGHARNLTTHAAGDFRPAWSPDGAWLAFSSDRHSTRPRFTFTEAHSTEVYVIRADGSGLRRITNEQGAAGAPAWSDDGTHLAYYLAPVSELVPLASRAASGGTTQLVAFNLSTGDSKILTSGPGAKVFPQWRGNALAYFDRRAGALAFTDGTPGTAGQAHAPHWRSDFSQVVFDRDVSDKWPPFQPAYSRDATFGLIRTGFFPQFAPDGSKVTMGTSPLGIARNGILMMGADGSGASVVFDDPTHSALAPVWSPDGRRLAFGLGRYFPMLQGFSPAQLATLDVGTKQLQLLTQGDHNIGFPGWSPDGKRIVYRQWTTDASSLHILDVETRVSTVLLKNFGRVNFPSWSPDGRSIQFTSDHDGSYEIYTIDPTNRRVSRLTSSPGNDAHASWSPDGEWLAFTSVRGGYKDEAALNPGNPQASGDIYVMRADGSDVRALTENPFEEGSVGWVPMKR